MSSDNHMSQHDPDYFDDDEPRDQWCRDFEGHKALHEFCVDHQAAAAFIAHYRKNGGCSHCGGIPHTTTCYVGRMEAALQQSQVPAPAWQPIETAPKDGSAFVMLDANTQTPALGHWEGRCRMAQRRQENRRGVSGAGMVPARNAVALDATTRSARFRLAATAASRTPCNPAADAASRPR